MSEMISRVAKSIVLSDGLNPMERMDCDSGETIWRWQTYTPRARAAIEVIKRDAPKHVAGWLEEQINAE